MKWRSGKIWSLVLDKLEIDRLATYNTERMRGIVHTELWKAKMELLQQTLDRESHE